MTKKKTEVNETNYKEEKEEGIMLTKTVVKL